MAGPFPFSVPPTPGGGARRAAVVTSVALASVVGCGFVPKAKLDECRRVTQALRAENSQLKDRALDLRAQNHDLGQRAVDDAKRLTAQQEAVEHLEKSVQAYQAERDQLAEAFETLKRQVRLSAAAAPAASAGRDGNGPLRDFAGSRPGAGWTFDPKSGALAVAADRLFERGTTKLKPGAGDELKELAGALKSGALADGQALEVVGLAPGAPEEVRRAGFEVEGTDTAPDGAASASGRFLVTGRAARVRAALIEASELGASRVRLAPPSDKLPGADAPAARGGPGRVEFRVVPGAAAEAADCAALDSGPDAAR
jgi:hypothetical protein